MEVNHKVEEESSDLPRVPDERVNKKKNDSPSVSDISDDDSSSESSDAPKLPPKPVKPRRSRTSMLASFGFDINDAGKVSSVFTALDEREAAEQERKRQEKEAKRLKREKLRQERERKRMEREEKNQRENESEQNIKSTEDTNDGSLPPIRDDNEQPKQAHTSDVPNGDVRPNTIVAKTEQSETNGELPRKKRKYVRKPKEEPEEGKEKKRRRKDSEDTKPRKKRRKDSDENAEEKDKEVTKKKRRRKESNGEEEKPKRRRKKNNNNTEERSEEEPKKKRRKKKKEDDVSHDKSDSTNSVKKTTRKRKPKRETSKKSEAENEKSESDNKATRASKDEDDESSESGEEWTLIEEDLLPGDTLTIFSKQVFNEGIKKHAKTAAARALDRGYGYPMVPFPKLKPKYQPRKGLYDCFKQFAANNQIAAPAPLLKGRKDFRIPYGAEYASEHSAMPNIEEDDKRLHGSRKIQHPKKRLLSHLRSSSDGSKQSDLAQDEVDNFVKINTAESM